MAGGLADRAQAIDLSDDLGFYDGTWHNLTFDSIGDMDFTFSSDGTSITVAIELTGNVFGLPAPTEPLIYSFLLPTTPGATSIDLGLTGDPLLGDVVGSISVLDWQLDLTATNFPASSPAFGFDAFNLTGTITGGVIDLAYTIDAFGGEFANGEIDARQIPEPATALLLGLGGVAATRRLH
ncbi:PEP-CTERM sorting domain-containing protein [Mucisphaera sp.]|uniref:PEP-CTERM sorting domain-containing protein n=1 Tax=Mucisphaera sp. TaxID=2913024 RepID=UPI003D0BDEDE